MCDPRRLEFVRNCTDDGAMLRYFTKSAFSLGREMERSSGQNQSGTVAQPVIETCWLVYVGDKLTVWYVLCDDHTFVLD